MYDLFAQALETGRKAGGASFPGLFRSKFYFYRHYEWV